MGWRVNLFLYRLGRTIGWEEDYSDCWLFSIVVIVPDLILLSVTVFKTVFCFPVKTVSCFQITPKYVPKFHRKQCSVFNKPKTVFCFQQNSFFFYSFLFSNYRTREKQKNEQWFFFASTLCLSQLYITRMLVTVGVSLDKSVTHLSIYYCVLITCPVESS